jgi:acyl-CoA synthetase (NDP forming)
MTEAAEAGAGSVAIFGRCHEADTGERPPMTERLGAIARAAGMAVLGGNCMGFVNIVDKLKVVALAPPVPDRPGPIGLISHSGSTWSAFLANQRQLSFNYVISAGQEIATTLSDYLAFLVEQPETRAVGLILETVRDPAGFLAALQAADRRGIAVVALKLGRTERSREFTRAHSGALAGSDAAFDAVCRRHNVVRVRTFDEMADTLELFGRGRPAPADGLAIVTDSGGERQVIVDIAADRGVKLAALAPATLERLAAKLDPGFEAANPLDAWGDGGYIFEDCLKILTDDPAVGVVAMASNMVPARAYLHKIADSVAAVAATAAKPIVAFGNMHSTICRDKAAELRGKGVPVLMGTESALIALDRFLAFHARRRAPAEGHSPAVDSAMTARWRQKLAPGGEALSAADSLALLADFGVPIVASRVTASRDAAVDAAGALGFPVVLKTANPAILHKTEMGGVALNLADGATVARAYDRVAAACGPMVEIQAHAPEGVELLLGMTRDSQFGPIVTVAAGGVMVELLADAISLVPPFSAATALAALDRLKLRSLLNGFRGKPAADLARLAQAIERFGAMAAALGDCLSEFDANPVIAGPAGAIAVDGLAVPRRPKHL